ncbi:hypothetical protein HPP92_012794 [Vanilla planifolia]|uniref:Uncharacterized protein n=1 Tax=Vanilla planifolia TaxID=51239 RepID=A0A835UZD8_VANPL|nr:hypothetical protein HPP92_012794 [Vanilla planifolia]
MAGGPPFDPLETRTKESDVTRVNIDHQAPRKAVVGSPFELRNLTHGCSSGFVEVPRTLRLCAAHPDFKSAMTYTALWREKSAVILALRAG